MADGKKITNNFLSLLDTLKSGNVGSRSNTTNNSRRTQNTNQSSERKGYIGNRNKRNCGRDAGRDEGRGRERYGRRERTRGRGGDRYRGRGNIRNRYRERQNSESSTRFDNNNKQSEDNCEPGSKRHAYFDSERPSKKFCERTLKMTGSKFVEGLLDREPRFVLTTLANPTSGFQELLNDRPLTPDLLVLLIRLLKKVTESDIDQLKLQILSETFQPEFIDDIKQYVVLISIEDNKQRLESIESFFSDVLSLFETVINLFPSIMNERLKSVMVALNLSMKNVKDQLEINLSDGLFEQLKSISNQVSSFIENKKKADRQQQPVCGQNTQAPDNFRNLELVPTLEDFMCDKAFVRQNIVKGSYRDVEHYLDVQFRLLREDFIAPLRAGIYEYIDSLSTPHLKRKYSNVRIYPKVQFADTFQSKGKFGYLVYFDCDKKLPRNMNWEYNKRFMFGSLLLFSTDHFKTFSVATVIERDRDKLQKGSICVSFVAGTDVPENLFEPETFFVMAESEVYYEAYHPVLSALKRMKENNFPMKRYIVDVDVTACLPPDHLTKKSVYKISGLKVNLLDNDSWPTPDELKLNSSQHQAFKSALTNNFAVIQGPPGTGKTFLALKIAKVLLRNKVSDDSPIVVICYTNHALDQFLEGILKYTTNLIRIGSQSKNEILLKHSIEQVRKNRGLARTSALYRNILRDKFKLQENIQRIEKKIDELNTPNGILDLYVLKSVITPQHYRELEHKEVDWLLWYEAPDLSTQEVLEENEALSETQAPVTLDQPRNVIESQEKIGEEMDDDENTQHLADMIEDDFFEDDFTKKEMIGGSNVNYSLNIDVIKANVMECEHKLRTSDSPGSHREMCRLEQETIEYSRKMNWLINFILKQFVRFKDLKFNPVKFKMFKDMKSVWEIGLDDRWEYYLTWVHLYSCQLKHTKQFLTERYQSLLLKLQELKQLGDLELVRTADVVGLTTSGAAKRRVLLENLNTKIECLLCHCEMTRFSTVPPAHIETSYTQCYGWNKFDSKEFVPSVSQQFNLLYSM